MRSHSTYCFRDYVPQPVDMDALVAFCRYLGSLKKAKGVGEAICAGTGHILAKEDQHGAVLENGTKRNTLRTPDPASLEGRDEPLQSLMQATPRHLASHHGEMGFKQGAGSEGSQRSSGLLLSDNPFSPNTVYAVFVPQGREYLY